MYLYQNYSFYYQNQVLNEYEPFESLGLEDATIDVRYSNPFIQTLSRKNRHFTITNTCWNSLKTRKKSAPC